MAHGSAASSFAAVDAPHWQQVFIDLGLTPFEHQQRAIEAQGDGFDVLLCAATSGGKSKSFQVPAYAEPETLTVVISPLVELI